jgi:hypothetical protein
MLMKFDLWLTLSEQNMHIALFQLEMDLGVAQLGRLHACSEIVDKSAPTQASSPTDHATCPVAIRSVRLGDT